MSLSKWKSRVRGTKEGELGLLWAYQRGHCPITRRRAVNVKAYQRPTELAHNRRSSTRASIQVLGCHSHEIIKDLAYLLCLPTTYPSVYMSSSSAGLTTVAASCATLNNGPSEMGGPVVLPSSVTPTVISWHARKPAASRVHTRTVYTRPSGISHRTSLVPHL